MYSDEWQKIKTKVPLDLWKKVELLGFDDPDKAVINGLEKLCFDPELNIYGKEQEIRIQELKNRLEDEQKRNQEFQREFELRVEEARAQTKNLQIEKQELEKRQEEQKYSQEFQKELELRMEEAQRQIQDLQKGLEKAERRETYFEEMHNNYMMQMQTLINQKQIVAP